MSTINITAYPEDASRIKINNEESLYDPAFIAKIEKSRQHYQDGKGTIVTIEELKNSLEIIFSSNASLNVHTIVI